MCVSLTSDHHKEKKKEEKKKRVHGYALLNTHQVVSVLGKTSAFQQIAEARRWSKVLRLLA